jgi:hypothetical protein
VTENARLIRELTTSPLTENVRVIPSATPMGMQSPTWTVEASTATPIPISATPNEPSATATRYTIVVTGVPTQAPVAMTIAPSVDRVLAAFHAAGLAAENAQAMTKDDYGLAPLVCTGTRFLIPTLGSDKGGRVFICPGTAERDALAEYYARLGKASAAFFSWVFVRDNVLVQLNGDLDETIARRYEAALAAALDQRSGGCPQGCTTHLAGCDIKGNVSKRNNDEKIYHLPGDPDYDRTQVNPAEGDRWFCTVAEAEANGFRPSQRQ